MMLPLRNVTNGLSQLLISSLTNPLTRNLPVRTAVVVERLWDHPPVKKYSGVLSKKKRYRVYKTAVDTRDIAPQYLNVILTEDIDELGRRGDLVRVRKAVARNQLLAQNQAVYASPENIAEFENELKEQIASGQQHSISLSGEQIVKMLAETPLRIEMPADKEWVVDADIIKLFFQRKMGLHVPVEAILNSEELNIDKFGSYCLPLVINKVNEVSVQLDVCERVPAPVAES